MFKIKIDGVEYEINDSNIGVFQTAYGDLEQYKIEEESFQQDPASAETSVGSENNMVSNSENGLLESNPPPERYINYKRNGKDASMSETEYNDFYAGLEDKGRYPEDFDTYVAKTFPNTKIQITNFDDGAMLDEVVVEGKLSDEVKQAKKDSKELATIIEAETPEANHKEIAGDYFTGLNNDGQITGMDRPQFFPTLKNPDGSPQMWQGKERKSGFSEYTNDYDTDLKNHLGPEKYSQYITAKKLAEANGETLTKENASRYISLELIQGNKNDNTINSVVSSKKSKAAEKYIRDIGGFYVTDEEQKRQDLLEQFTGTDEVVTKKNTALLNEKERALRDARDFEAKFGRPLVRTEKLQGRTYTPFNRELTLDKVEAEEGKRIAKEAGEIENAVKIFDTQATELNNVQDEIRNYSIPDADFNNPEEVAFRKSLFDRQKVLMNELQADQLILQARADKLTNDLNVYGTTNVADAALVKSYQTSDLLANTWESAFLGSAAQLGGAIVSPFDGGTSYEAATNYNERLQNNAQKYLPQALTSDDDSSAAQYFGDMLIRNSPSIAVAVATMGSGAGLTGAARLAAIRQASNASMGVFFTMEAGGQLSNLEIQQREAPKMIAALNQQIKEAKENGAGLAEINKLEADKEYQENILSLNAFQKGLNSTFYGGTAALAERLGTLGFIKNFQKYSRAIGGNTLRKQFGESLGTSISKGLGNVTAVGAIGPGIELIEEGTTLVAQNLSDNLIFQPENPKSLIDGLDGEFFRNTYVTSLAIGGVGASQNVMTALNNEVKTRKQAKQENEIRDQLIDVSNKLNTLDGRTKEARELKQERDNLISDAADLNTAIPLNLKSLTGSEINRVFENAASIRKLKYQASQLDLADFDARDRREFERLKDAAQVLYNENQSILGKSEAEIEKLAKNTANPLATEVNFRRFNMFKEIAKETKGVNVLEINNEEQFNAYIKENNLEGKGYSYAEAGSAGQFNNDILIFNEIAAVNMQFQPGIEAEIASVSPLHELGHWQVKQQGIIKDNKIVSASNDMVSSIINDVKSRFDKGNISKEAFDNFNKRIAKYKDEDVKGVDADELLQLVSDFTAIGILPKSSFGNIYGAKTFVNSILKKVNGNYSHFFKINSPSDVYAFVANWQNRALVYQLPEGEEKESDKIKPSRAVENVRQRLESIPLEQLPSRGAQNIIANELFGMVDAQIRNRLNLSQEVREELQADVIARVYEAQENTKWDGRGSLYGFLNGRISKRILDALRANPDYLDVVTKQELTGLEKASEVVVDDQQTVKKEKPKFRNLLQSRVLPADALELVQKKLISTIRVLKSKLSADISINRTVTPLIAEIKKEMGKQADIEFKKRLGPKKDGILRKNYLRFKKPILENMTTTWLMGAMPFAIQKQVDGKFTSDWQGKKIDRETVDTDKAGRTSGADIVRRLPNIADKVTDEQFLSYMFKDGDVIRGRKESLSKALAEEIAFDLFNSELQKPDSELRKAFVNNQTALGVELADNFVQEVQKDTERGNIKFSKGLATLTPSEFKAFQDGLPNLKDNLAKLNNDYGKTKTAIKKVLQNTYGDKFTKKQYEGISLQFFNLLKPLNKSFPRKYVNVSEQELREYVDQVAQDVDGNASIQLYTGASDSIKNLWNTGANVYIAQQVIEDALSKLPIETVVAFFSGTFANSGKVGMRNFKDANENFRADFYGGVDQWLPALKRMFPQLESIQKNGDIVLKNGEVIKKKFTATGSVTKGMLDANFDTDKDIKNATAAWEFTTAVVKGIKNENADIQAMVLAAMNSGTNTALRAAAPVLYRTAGFNSLDKNDYRYEHALPARRVLFDMYKSIVKGDKSINLKALKDDYKVALIPKTMDKVIGDQGLGPIAVAGYVAGQTPWYSRYYNILTRGKVQYALESLQDGSIIGQNYADYFNSTNDPEFVKSTAIQDVKSNENFEKALKFSKSLDYGINPKGITVLDFDDTVAISSSRVIVKMPVKDKDILDIAARRKFGNTVFKDKQDFQKTFNNLSEEQKKEVLKEVPGTTKKITPAEFAAESVNLENQGAIFDFSEFNKVVKGRKGPLFDLALKRQAKFGNDNIYILTARPQQSALAIQKFAEGLGLNLKLNNITGLADGRPEAKADWIVGKVNEGFNDFYFADDAYKNVKAVQEALNLFDVKSDVQQAKIKFSKGLKTEVNQMIERNKGVRAETTYSKAVARRNGAKKGRFKFFLPFGAEDFRGLTSYVLAGKGKQGDADQKFFEDNLINPYVTGVAAMERARRALKNDYLGLRRMFPAVRKLLRKRIPGLEYTHDQAIRIYLYNKSGFEVPGLSKRDLNKINKLINGDADLKAFADGLQLVTKKSEWVQPSEYWDSSSILQELNEISEKVSRKEYLAEFINNVDAVFDEQTLNKLEAIYGTNYVDALNNIISRMKSGINRPNQPGKYERQWLNWVNNSVGTIMFFNRRSAILQMLSFANFVNWSDNNPLKAGLAFANQPAYWSAWSKIFNSDKLKERRGGLKSDIQEQEIANQARNSKNKAGAIVSYLLKIGFTPTQIADSMAIATGGATFLINRTKSYVKQGMSKADAEAAAFQDFSKISDETQQSGDPMLISAQQSSHLGRLILAFQNTPMQYTRLMKKAGQDILNGRGDFKTNVSKIAYYGFIQNLLFNSLQQALFAMLPGFDEPDEEEEEDKEQAKLDKKQERILNGMLDSILRGSGLYGAIASTLKNAYMRYIKEEEKGFTADHTYTLLELANISPPIGSKLRKVYGAIQTNKFDRGVIEKRGLEAFDAKGNFNLSPSYQIMGNLTSAFFNLPLDRVVAETNSLTEMLDDRNTAYQRIALALGWRTWDVNAKNEYHDFLTLAYKQERADASKEKAAFNRLVKKQEEFDRLAAMSPSEKAAYLAAEKKKRSDAAKKAAITRARNKRIKDSILYNN
jgi:hypothetical protein